MIGDAGPPPPPDRLDEWKEVAAYLGQERTGSIFAYRSELDTWWQQQSTRLSQEPSVVEAGLPRAPEAAIERPSRNWALIAAGAGLLALALAAGYLVKPASHPASRLVPLTTDLGWEDINHPLRRTALTLLVSPGHPMRPASFS